MLLAGKGCRAIGDPSGTNAAPLLHDRPKTGRGGGVLKLTRLGLARLVTVSVPTDIRQPVPWADARTIR